MKDKILNLLFLAGVLALMGAGFREYLIHHGKLTSELNANGFAVTNMPTPVASGDAANKGYVDSEIIAATGSIVTAESDPVWLADKPSYTTLDYENARETNTLAYVETNIVASATNTLATTVRGEIAAAEPGDYANVSNKAMTALQSGGRATGLGLGSSSDYWYLSGGMNYRVKDGSARPTSIFYWPGYGSTSDLVRLYEVTAAIAAATNSIDMSAYIPWSSANSYSDATKYSLCLERHDGSGRYFAVEESGTGGDGPFLFKTYMSGIEGMSYGNYRPRIYVGDYTGNYLAYYYDVTNYTDSVATTLRGEIAAIDVAPTVSNIVSTAYVHKKLGVWMEYDEATGFYYYCHEEE